MKKSFLFLVLCCFTTAVITAQEQDTINAVSGNDPQKEGMYFGIGAAFNNGYKISDRLEASGVPRLSEEVFEFSVGYNYMFRKWLLDIELNAAYYDEKSEDSRIKNTGLASKIRTHYVPFKTQSVFLSGGLDLSYLGNIFNLYSRGNVIDLNDLNPATHTGHISLYNGMLYAGPSIAFGAFQNTHYGLRLNLGYEWAVISGKWKSEVADVANTFRESGNGRAYARLTLYLD